jgi:hypothetical protein
MSLPKTPRTRAYVVVRYDAAASAPERQFTAEEVVDSDVVAQAEVERLGGLSAATGVRYFYQAARLHRPGAGGAAAAPKATAIRTALRRLGDRLGATIEVVDHWPADPYAVAVAARRAPARLAYISAYEKPPGRYDVHLERVPDPRTGRPYRDRGYLVDLDIDGVVSVVARHIEGPLTPTAG